MENLNCKKCGSSLIRKVKVICKCGRTRFVNALFTPKDYRAYFTKPKQREEFIQDIIAYKFGYFSQKALEKRIAKTIFYSDRRNKLLREEFIRGILLK